MLAEIIPAIIAKSFKELKEKVEKVEPYVNWVQLDIMDGKFVPNTTWNMPEDLMSWKPRALLAAHLMIFEPEKYVEQWIDAGIKRVTFHIEATLQPMSIIQYCRKMNVACGIALNPETSIMMLEPFLKLIDLALVMGVTPGFSGQEFQEGAISKISALRSAHPYLTIGVDGGMNPKTAKQVIDAGAGVIVAGSYIFESSNIERAIEELKAL